MLAARHRHHWLLSQLLVFIAICGGSAWSADECPVEVKLLLSPAQAQSVVAALGATSESRGRVYLYDTDNLDLLTEGLIIRVRQGTSNDLMVKVRPRSAMQIPDFSGAQERYKCESDMAGENEQPSFSITRPFTGPIPVTGVNVQDALSAGQKRLLEQAHAAIDWSRVRRIAEVQATSWDVSGQGELRKMSLELWQWPGGEALELSSKVKAKRGATAYSALQDFAKAKGLKPASVQQLKTSMVLQTVTTR